MIKAVRIDHRLVHGQVAFSWTHYLGATRIIVIDDKAASDDFQKMALKMSKPAGCKLNVFSVEKALENAAKIDSLSDIVFIVFGQTHDAARYITAHPTCKELNVGGTVKKPGKISVIGICITILTPGVMKYQNTAHMNWVKTPR